jgi:hypothetical protein
MELKVSVFNIGFVIFPQLTQLDFTGRRRSSRDCRMPRRTSWAKPD